MDMTKFEMLEGRINALIEKMTALSGENADLQSKLEETQKDLEAAEGLIQGLEEERQSVLAKVDAMLAKLA